MNYNWSCVLSLALLVLPAAAEASTQANSIASAEVKMERAKPPYLPANAEYMSVGPWGEAVPDTAPRRPGQFHVDMGLHHRLRVTISSSERIAWLTIDDILTGRADTRIVTAEYTIYPFTDLATRGVWTALQDAPRVLGPDTTGPPIAWVGPMSFAWITRADTLVFDQKADSVFNVTIRARVR